MRSLHIILLILAGMSAFGVAAVAEPPTIYGLHFFREAMNLDCFNGKVGWITELVNTDTWASIDHNRYRDQTNEGHTFLLRLNWGRPDNWPATAAEEDQWASECSYFAEQCKPYTHIYVLGNEDGPYPSAFSKVRWAIHAVQPDAFVVAGAPNSYSGYGDWVDGFAAHTDGPSWADSVDSAYLANKCKPLYVTECCGAPPKTYGAMQTVFNVMGQWNQTHAHKIECANRFVYYEFGSEYSSQMLIPMWDGDFSESTTNTNWTNSYANPYIVMTNIAATPTSETSATISWTTDVASSTQVEYWKAGERTQTITPYVDVNTTSHSVSLTGLTPGATYYYQVKSYVTPRPWTVSSPKSFRQLGPGTGRIAGRVKDKSGAGVEGAVVTRAPGGYTAKCAADGSYEFAGVSPGTYTLSVTYVGSNSASSSGVVVTSGNTTTVNFSVTRKANLLTNGGFEAGSQTGWTSYGDAMETRGGSWFGDIVAHSGSYFVGKAGDGTYGNGGMYQRVAVTAGQSYTARLWSAVYRLYCPYHVQYTRVGIDSTGGTDPNSSNVKWSSADYGYSPGDNSWEELSSPAVTPTGGYVTVFLDYKMISSGAWLAGWHICCFDDAALVGPQLQTVSCARVSDAKNVEDGAPVSLTGRVVTATKAQLGDRMYIEDPDRASGIQVYLGSTSNSANVGDIVSVSGTMTTRSGERAITNPTVTTTGSTSPLKALVTRGTAVGGSGFNYQAGPPASGQMGVVGGVGANNIGLLLQVTGEVKSAGSGYVMLDDGSPRQLKVDVSRATPPAVGKYVVITGVLSAYLDGSDLKPLLIARNAGDVVLMP